MSKDALADVRAYAPQADEAIVDKMESTYRLAMSRRDSAAVAFGDPSELITVRENFLKKKLGLTLSDDELDQAIKEVGQKMKGAHTRSRITVYYLLAEKFGKLDVFK